MGKYNPEKHHRRSIRLKGYDYSREGFYFLTLCVQNRKYLFEIPPNDNVASCCRRPKCRPKVYQIEINEAGKMIEKWYFELEKKFPGIKCHEMVVMPNHFHCIIEIKKGGGGGSASWADTQVRPNGEGRPNVSTVMQWFKTMTTNEYIRGVKILGWERFEGKLWQRDYFEHIIRNKRSFDIISNYIRTNPIKWNNDRFR
jgi:putative transposase